jgi:hypothetical protein
MLSAALFFRILEMAASSTWRPEGEAPEVFRVEVLMFFEVS